MCGAGSAFHGWLAPTTPSPSPSSDRIEHGQQRDSKEQGFRVIPVNPLIDEALGEKSYADLKSIPQDIHMADIFRRSELVGRWSTKRGQR